MMSVARQIISATLPRSVRRLKYRWEDECNLRLQRRHGGLRKLNFGCGYDKRLGYLNVDSDRACNPDVLIERGDLSCIPRHAFDEVLAKDVLEHLPWQFTLPLLLDFADFLVDNGKLILQTTSILHVASKLQRSNRFDDHHGWTTCLFGNQQHAGDFHHTGFTEVSLRVYLLAAGFHPNSWEMRDDWMFYVEATRQSDWTLLASGMHHASDEEFLQQAYRTACCRKPSTKELAKNLKSLRMGIRRKTILKRIFSESERLYNTAQHHGF